MTAKILVGDVRARLKDIETGSVQTCVTSPPYWGLRDYGTAEWEDGDGNCDHIQDESKTKQFGNPEFNENRPSRKETKTKGFYYEKECEKCGAKRVDSQIGLEQSPNEYVEQLVQVFREVRRVLRDDGTLWLNLGDSYASFRDGKAVPDTTRGDSLGTLVPKGLAKNRMATTFIGTNIKHKDLVGIPWRVAFALQADGWYLRQDIIWAKPNPMPESVKDRCTKSHEYVFLLSKSPKYYFDNEAIKEDAVTGSWDKLPPIGGKKHQENGNPTYSGNQPANNGKRNKRDVWTINTKPFKGAHFAVMPEALVTPCVLAGSRGGDTVLDPFAGSGTVGVVALREGRKFIGAELNPEYAAMAVERIGLGAEIG